MTTTHGHRAKRTPTYHSWNAMRQRTSNPNRADYEYYGGIGVTVCDRWAKFANFLEDMGDRPAGKTIDRINPFGNYEPENCRWGDARTQNNNLRKHFHAGQHIN